MHFIITALKNEAQPIIDHYRLKKVDDAKFLIFQNQDITLIISGIGKINSSIATTYLLNQNTIKQNDHITNIGLCGSTKHNIGNAIYINKIIDKSSNKVFHLNREGESITCYDTPQTSSKKESVDMESYGFYQASKKFMDIKYIKIIKVVSDKIENKILTQQEVYNLILPHIKELV
jgi:nucleoside phosphorylase